MGQEFEIVNPKTGQVVRKIANPAIPQLKVPAAQVPSATIAPAEPAPPAGMATPQGVGRFQSANTGGFDPRYSSEVQRQSGLESFVEGMNPFNKPGRLLGSVAGGMLGGPAGAGLGWYAGGLLEDYLGDPEPGEARPDMSSWRYQVPLLTESALVGAGAGAPRAVGTMWNMARGTARPQPVRNLLTRGMVSPEYTSRVAPVTDVGAAIRRQAAAQEPRTMRSVTHQAFGGEVAADRRAVAQTTLAQQQAEKAADIGAMGRMKSDIQAIMPTPPPYAGERNIPVGRRQFGQQVSSDRARALRSRTESAYAPLDEIAQDEANAVPASRRVTTGKEGRVATPEEQMIIPVAYGEAPTVGEPMSLLREHAMNVAQQMGFNAQTLAGARSGPEHLLNRLINQENYIANVPLREAMRDLSWVRQLKRRAWNAPKGEQMAAYHSARQIESGLLDAIVEGVGKAPNVDQAVKDSVRELIIRARDAARMEHDILYDPESVAAFRQFSSSGITQLMGVNDSHAIPINEVLNRLGEPGRKVLAWEHMKESLDDGLDAVLKALSHNKPVAQPFYDAFRNRFMSPGSNTLREVYTDTELQAMGDFFATHMPAPPTAAPAVKMPRIQPVKETVYVQSGKMDPYKFVKHIGSDAEKLEEVRRIEGSAQANQYAAQYVEDLVRRGASADWLGMHPLKKIEIAGGAGDPSSPAVVEILDNYFSSASAGSPNQQLLGNLLRELSYIPNMFPAGPGGVAARMVARLEGRVMSRAGQSKPGFIRKAGKRTVGATTRTLAGTTTQATAKGIGTSLQNRSYDEKMKESLGVK